MTTLAALINSLTLCLEQEKKMNLIHLELNSRIILYMYLISNKLNYHFFYYSKQEINVETEITVVSEKTFLVTRSLLCIHKT